MEQYKNSHYLSIALMITIIIEKYNIEIKAFSLSSKLQC